MLVKVLEEFCRSLKVPPVSKGYYKFASSCICYDSNNNPEIIHSHCEITFNEDGAATVIVNSSTLGKWILYQLSDITNCRIAPGSGSLEIRGTARLKGVKEWIRVVVREL